MLLMCILLSKNIFGSLKEIQSLCHERHQEIGNRINNSRRGINFRPNVEIHSASW